MNNYITSDRVPEVSLDEIILGLSWYKKGMFNLFDGDPQT